MANKLDFADEVESDLSEAYRWYEKRRIGLGEDFLGCVDASLERIKRDPQIFAKVHENCRRALVRRFPYAIFFEVLDEVTVIYGVIHTARDQDKWRERLPS
jgi:toxin ParE1/3/4